MIHILRKKLPAARAADGPTSQQVLWHAVEAPDGTAPQGSKALCGFKPAYPWADEVGTTITCPRCKIVVRGAAQR